MKMPCCTARHKRHWFGVAGSVDVHTPRPRRGDTVSGGGKRGMIGRLRHFKSPDDRGGDDGNMDVALQVNARATFGFSSSVCFQRYTKAKGKAKRKIHRKIIIIKKKINLKKQR